MNTVGRILRAEDREGREVERLGDAVVDRGTTPDEMHHFLDQVEQPEREEQLGHVTVLVHSAQAPALGQRAEHTYQDWRYRQCRPEPDVLAQLEREVRPQHVEARVREVEHAHHAEDQRQP
jgi:hypothetical protein